MRWFNEPDTDLEASDVLHPISSRDWLRLGKFAVRLAKGEFVAGDGARANQPRPDVIVGDQVNNAVELLVRTSPSGLFCQRAAEDNNNCRDAVVQA
jgi:hypothetical protein